MQLFAIMKFYVLMNPSQSNKGLFWHPRPAVTWLSRGQALTELWDRKVTTKNSVFWKHFIELPNPSRHIYFISHLLGVEKQLLCSDSALKSVNSYYISIRAAWNSICFVWRELMQIFFDVSIHKGSYPTHLALSNTQTHSNIKDCFFSIKHLAWG